MESTTVDVSTTLNEGWRRIRCYGESGRRQRRQRRGSGGSEGSEGRQVERGKSGIVLFEQRLSALSGTDHGRSGRRMHRKAKAACSRGSEGSGDGEGNGEQRHRRQR